MKKRLLGIILSALTFAGQRLTANAQDTLVFHDSHELYVKIVEIGEDKITYRRSDNLNGPLYSCSRADVFMAFYRGGAHEILYKTAGPDATRAGAGDQGSAPAQFTLADETFHLELKHIDSKKVKNSIVVTGDVDVISGNALFATVEFTANQRLDAALDFSHPRPAHVFKSGITMTITSTQLKDYLYEKYENPAGNGLGWVLPPGFLGGAKTGPATSGGTGPCQVAYLKKPKQGETDLTWLQGKLEFEKYDLKSCGTLEEKLLSVVLLWLNKNFTPQKN